VQGGGVQYSAHIMAMKNKNIYRYANTTLLLAGTLCGGLPAHAFAPVTYSGPMLPPLSTTIFIDSPTTAGGPGGKPLKPITVPESYADRLKKGIAPIQVVRDGKVAAPVSASVPGLEETLNNPPPPKPAAPRVAPVVPAVPSPTVPSPTAPVAQSISATISPTQPVRVGSPTVKISPPFTLKGTPPPVPTEAPLTTDTGLSGKMLDATPNPTVSATTPPAKRPKGSL
jgi:hypothetical protein